MCADYFFNASFGFIRLVAVFGHFFWTLFILLFYSFPYRDA